MIMTNIKRKKRSFFKKTIKPLSKISFINDNVFKSIMIIKNLWINTRTKLTIICHWIFYGRKFFCNNIDVEKMKIMKDYLKENKF